MYKVRFYEEKSGKRPIRDFMNNSEHSLKSKIIRQLKYLEIYGLTHENPNLKKIVGTRFWEVRILGRDSARIICVVIINNEVLVLRIFKKKGNKTSPKDLNLALKRYQTLDK